MDVQWQIKQNVSEANDFLDDLQSWKKDIKKKSTSKKKSSRDRDGSKTTGKAKEDGGATVPDLDNYVPPVRGRVQTTVRKLGKEYRKPASQLTDPAKGLGEKKEKKKVRKKKPKKVKTLPQHAAGHTYDYFKDKWDKFDVDTALEEASQSSSYETEEEEEEQVIEEIVNPDLPEEAKGTEKKKSAAAAPTLDTQQQQSSKIQKVNTDLSATQWKEKGNDYFRTAQYQRALECYTGSINAEPTAVAYANRAMALMKLREFEQAVEDASEALEIDPNYLKAYQRRGAAYKELGSYLNALRDYESALRLSPQSQALRAERSALIATFCSKEGLERVNSRVKLPLSDLRENTSKANNNKPSEVKGPIKRSKKKTPAEKVAVAAASAKEGDPKLEEGGEVVHGRSQHSPPPTTTTTTTTTKPKKPVHPLPVSDTEREVPVPKNAVEFEITWKSIKDNEDSKWKLLRKLEPGKMAALAKNMLTGDLVFSIVKCILTKMKEDTAHGIRLLENLAQTPRFKINVMSIPSKKRAELKTEWDDHIHSAPEEWKKSILEVAKLYGAIK
jgi:tetratricopeptide (TPR) repeat protein